MKWKTKNRTFLIQKKFHTIPFIYGSIGLEGGERFNESAEYVEIDFSGQLVKKYSEPLPFSIEDEMTISNIYRVIDNCFYEFYYSHRFRSEPEITTTLLLSELEPFAGALPFDAAILFD